MIEAALRLIANELDQHLRVQSPGGAGLVVLTDLTDAQGAPLPDVANKLALFLVNIEREDVPTRALRRIDVGEDRTAAAQPPVHLSLLIMIAANFSGSTYNEALKLIATTIGFFQGRPVLNRLNTPALDPGIDQLSLEIENLSPADLSNLWGVLGGRYRPSVLYRLRLITIDSQRLERQPHRVEQAPVQLAARGG
jgi:hypothetical protein